VVARAQHPPMPVIGLLSSRSLDNSGRFLAAFRQGLNQAGFFEGQNVAIEYQSAEDRYDLMPALASELVRRQVAVIVAVGGVPPSLAAKAATSVIPIVFIIGGDPIKLGLVASNRPGGNVTGVTILSGTLTAKRLELLRELVPSAGVVAFLVNPASPEAETQLTDARAGRTFSL
jgi:putative ABC transport system substrate-binding protein